MNGREQQRLGRHRARQRARDVREAEIEVIRRLRAEAASVDPVRARRSTRATGSNPRKLGTAPRQQATNPTAGFASDAARVARSKRQALARHYVQTGERWCLHCDDSGWIQTTDHRGVERCDSHREMTATDAYFVLHPDD